MQIAETDRDSPLLDAIGHMPHLIREGFGHAPGKTFLLEAISPMARDVWKRSGFQVSYVHLTSLSRTGRLPPNALIVAHLW